MVKIYCPKCGWVPDAGDRWVCTRPIGCGHVWNTFATRGRCPGCGKQWRVTQCLSCKQFSPHEDWYHDDDDRDEGEWIDISEWIRAPEKTHVE